MRCLCYSLNYLILCFLAIAVGDNKLTTPENAGEPLAISIACECGGTTWGTSSDGAHPGLHSKPLDYAIG